MDTTPDCADNKALPTVDPDATTSSDPDAQFKTPEQVSTDDAKGADDEVVADDEVDEVVEKPSSPGGAPLQKHSSLGSACRELLFDESQDSQVQQEDSSQGTQPQSDTGAVESPAEDPACVTPTLPVTKRKTGSASSSSQARETCDHSSKTEIEHDEFMERVVDSLEACPGVSRRLIRGSRSPQMWHHGRVPNTSLCVIRGVDDGTRLLQTGLLWVLDNVTFEVVMVASLGWTHQDMV